MVRSRRIGTPQPRMRNLRRTEATRQSELFVVVKKRVTTVERRDGVRNDLVLE